MEEELYKNRLDLARLNESCSQLKQEISKIIVGQDKVIEYIMVAILADGHILLEGVPGVAKTLMAKLVAKAVSVDFSRIQFTPDLMPSDVLGTSVFNMSKSAFEFNKGPVFSNLVLVDEINRAPAKTQSALFEVMEERQATIDGACYIMQKPFLVFATQNPIEHEGTYRLPEAQLDRFLFKIKVGYPTIDEEAEILTRVHERKHKKETDSMPVVLSGAEIVAYQEQVKYIVIEENLRKYIAGIVDKTRKSPALYLGASPRASIYIMNSAKAFAAINGRDFVTPDDIRNVLAPVLCHRVQLTPEKEMEGVSAETVIKQIADSVEVPR